MAATDHQEYQELDNPFIKLCIFEKVNTFIKKLQYAEKGIITIEIMGYIDKILDMACK